MLKRLLKTGISAAVHLNDRLNNTWRAFARRPRNPRCVVLYYHAVRADQRDAFARQLDRILDLAQPIPADHAGPLPADRPQVMFTFDDGFISIIDHALPALQRRRIPFTLFVPTGCLGQRPAWIRDPQHPSWEERVLSADELRSLASEPLVTIGAHSVSHPNFLTLDPAAADTELRQSKADLEAVLGREVTLFSYPHGAHNDTLDRHALDLGFRRLFTIDPIPVTDPIPGPVLGRQAAEPGDWPLESRLKVAGAYRWMAPKRNRGSRDQRSREKETTLARRI